MDRILQKWLNDYTLLESHSKRSRANRRSYKVKYQGKLGFRSSEACPKLISFKNPFIYSHMDEYDYCSSSEAPRTMGKNNGWQKFLVQSLVTCRHIYHVPATLRRVYLYPPPRAMRQHQTEKVKVPDFRS